MAMFKILSVVGEGLIFGLVALGVYVAFKWLRFPDLTPDGSFTLGAVVFTKLAMVGCPLILGLVLSGLLGSFAGIVTASVNKRFGVPTVVAGLLVATALYSINWLILGRPNQFLPPSMTLGSALGAKGLAELIGWLVAVSGVTWAALWSYANTIWGLRLRALGENSLLSHDLQISEGRYTALGLGLANGLVGIAGAFFAQRSFSADVNMGLGITIAGLAGMTLGLILGKSRWGIPLTMLAVIVGSILYKTTIFLVLQLGLPAESFRAVSAGVLLIAFGLAGRRAGGVLGGLKWT